MFYTLLVKFAAFLATRYLNKHHEIGKKELIHTSNLIIKVERKYEPGFEKVRSTKTFSIHVFFPPGEISAAPCWRYEKYLFFMDGSYKLLRTGKYPHSWE